MGNRSSNPGGNHNLKPRQRQLGVNDVPSKDKHPPVRIVSNSPPPRRQPKPSAALIGNVLGNPLRDVRSEYSFGVELGRGQFGVTYLVRNNVTGQQFACKTIAKKKLVNPADVEDVRREVQILHHLSGYENIVALKGAYEDKYSVNLVMELCEGGELFERITKRGHYSERGAAWICRTMVKVVQICHSLGVMHRDLKPENFLFANRSEDAALKAVDFGLSVFYSPGEKFTDLVGSIFYIAPEVLRRSYGPEADIWSVGVILYILLSGVPPFWAKTDQGILDAIRIGHLNFASEPWPSISIGAKDVVKKMLNSNPKERWTATSILQHPWMREDGEAPDVPLDNVVLSRMKQFSATNKLKKLALTVIAKSLNEEEIIGLKKMFMAMDTDKSGTITLEELKNGLTLLGSSLVESEVTKLMQAADVDENGTIDYTEFIAATMNLNKIEKEDRIRSTFRYFDKDKSGYITIEELNEVLREHSMGDHHIIQDILKEVDTDNDGRINYNEFVAMMH
ncbi:hypothetical protein O6H91_08G007900 [Diphasiastrum complanatum]|uniref:Uncharacterized protein n=2 Tax=Diphasiastrum complanatum TaxID=34168 RepID=A0ACC2CUU3_DIPCM|nr:hypothetical protein O6H91_08G007900 [Diphasiastrum complanatum]KAJ7545742.1 hypothetical protein O6H91_08G007900 [Diphasiastrum complanatum]